MKIAFVDHLGVSGGIIRFGTQLANALIDAEKKIQLHYLTCEHNYQNNHELFNSYRHKFKVSVLKSTKKKSILKRVINKINPGVATGDERIHHEIIKLTDGFDVVFFTSAHMSSYINVKPKAFATFHDFNWKYLFGTPLFKKEDVKVLEIEIEKWFRYAGIIVSSEFIRKEIYELFPNVTKEVHVIYNSSVANKVNKADYSSILERLNLNKPYILYPGHIMPHKNHNNLCYAFYRIMQNPKFAGKYLLAFSGYGSDHFEYAQATPIGLRMSCREKFDVRGLGYLSNNDVDGVISNAALTVSSSLYETGSGPAIDAWINEVPVILSNIPSHVDQLKRFSISCITFNPMDSNDIYEKLTYALDNLELLKADSIAACKKMSEYNWGVIGKEYLKIFQKA